jgi:membrane protein insertase Oxa1/YidC/SpoIIIJ
MDQPILLSLYSIIWIALIWNYGIIILVLTLLLKTVLFPIAYKTYLSSARMRVLKPDIEELRQEIPQKGRCHEKATGTPWHCTKRQV